MHPGPSYGGHDPYRGQTPPPKPKRSLMLPALLVAGSLGGVALVMAGLLAYLGPVSDEEVYGPPIPQAAVQENAAGQVPPVDPGQPQNVSAVVPPAEVGPGGPDVPLTAAAPTAAPPLPVVTPPPPLKTTKATSPRKLAIPKIGVMTTLTELGIDAKRRVQTPPLSKPQLAGWYKHGPIPGQQGPSVILGHVNANGKAGVFSRLREIRRGDKIKVSRTDGAVVEFTVDGVEQVSKTAFPSKRVYGNTGEATLRLITCGGVYNPKTRHYTDNIIVYATLSATRRA
ncbi:class F sortase [Planobispora siamensis]|uniref:Class F sortase n=1 Tax=Planobispora siamensis TaxID=936338 RepID=A0A8J3SDF3_9ACTN|nr:class F sortase [Planobispora siamensis]GIH91319.1 hypothetical protein Psi01_19490 [Planobispora siamensis]